MAFLSHLVKKVTAATLICLGFISVPAFSASANSCLSSIDQHVFMISDAYSELDLSMCQLTDNDIPQVVNYLNQNPKINVLDLTENNLGPESGRLLAHINVPGVILGNNQLGDVGAKYLATTTSIIAIGLSHNGITDSGVRSLISNKNIIDLDLSDNHITDAGVIELAKDKSLQALWLGNLLGTMQISSVGINAIAKSNLSFALDLSNNIVGDQGTTAISHLNLFFLGLDHCGIGDIGAIALAQNPSKMLSLFDNHIGDIGAIALSKAQGLQFLDIGSNQVGITGVKALQNALNQGSLLYVNTEGNPGSSTNIMKSAIHKQNNSFKSAITQRLPLHKTH